MKPRLDTLIDDVRYVLNCLIELRNIQKLNNCNICARHHKCEWAPEWGEEVRFNCPHYTTEVTE